MMKIEERKIKGKLGQNVDKNQWNDTTPNYGKNRENG